MSDLVTATKAAADHFQSYERISWLLKAVSKNDMRPVLKCIHAEDARCWATDGHRLHLVKLPGAVLGLQPGKSYSLLKRTTKEIILQLMNPDGMKGPWSPPSIDGLFPQEAERYIFTKGGRLDCDLAALLAQFGHLIDSVDYQYFKDLDTQSGKFNAFYPPVEAGRQMWFDGDSEMALLMSIRSRAEFRRAEMPTDEATK